MCSESGGESEEGQECEREGMHRGAKEGVPVRECLPCHWAVRRPSNKQRLPWVGSTTLCSAFVRGSGGGSFNYRLVGTDFPGVCATGDAQSPINIVPSQAVKPLLGIPFSLNYQTSLVSTLVVKNISFEIKPDPTRPSFLSFSGETFKLLNLHAHAVSEHAFDGSLGPLEVHFVHESISNPGKLLVLGTFFSFHPSNQNNSFLASFLNLVPTTPGASITLTTPLNFLSLIAPTGLGLPLLGTLSSTNIYTYSGSLTTPGCDEVVTWLVIEPSKGPTLSVEQWEAFQIITSIVSGGVPINNRPPQPRNGRLLRVFTTLL